MASKKQGEVNNKVVLGLFVLLIVVGLPLTVVMVGQQTQWFNHAAGPSEQAITNLNSTTETIATINTDGTMGPQTSYGNWSNSLPTFLKGKLVFAVTDPVQGGKPSDPGSQGKRPTESFRTQPTQTLPSQAQRNGTQEVTSLNLTITKVEVHMAYQGKPSDRANTTPGEREKPSISPAQLGQAVDHWETLAINAPTTLDLVALAKTNDFSTLGITDLAEGRYTEIRLYVSGATATLTNGTTVDLQILGHDNIVRVVEPFTVVAGQSTKLTIDFDAQHSVIKAGDKYILKPVVARLLNEHQTQ